jgi:protein SCO1
MKKVTIVLTLLSLAGIALVLALTIPRPRPKATVTDVDPKKLFRPQLGTAIPSDIAFRDETGAAVTMGKYGKDRPFILVPVYFKCPSLCNEVLIELVKGLRGVAAYSVGKDYDVVVVSFDPREPPALAKAKKQSIVEAYDRPQSEPGWHFLTGEQEQIDRLLDSIGYKVQWDEVKKEYLHASGCVICSPDGTIVRYFPGLDYRPLYLRLAITEASEGTIRMGVIDQVLIPCFRFDATKGQYSAAVLTIVKGAGVITVGLIGVFWLGMWRFGRRPQVPGASVTVPVSVADASVPGDAEGVK